MLLTHQIKVNWPGNVEGFSEDEVEKFLRDAITWYNQHVGYEYFISCDDPEVLEIKAIKTDGGDPK